MSRPLRAELKRDFDAVRQVLLEVWDPVGVCGYPEDEYDSYIWPIVALLRGGADAETLLRHLANVEALSFGSTMAVDRRNPTVAALLALGIKAEGP